MWTIVIFFFKQKTAYEMCISDWSSDVCSSDLGEPGPGGDVVCILSGQTISLPPESLADRYGSSSDYEQRFEAAADEAIEAGFVLSDDRERSEEHTSELQSLMRISYAVFCLKQKNTQQLKTRVQKNQ